MFMEGVVTLAEFIEVINASKKMCEEKEQYKGKCDCPFFVEYGICSQIYGCTRMTDAFQNPEKFEKIIDDYQNGKDKYDTGGSTE